VTLIVPNQPLSKPSQIWGLVLMFSAVVLSPFYFYASGLPQPGHVLMLVASITLIALNAQQCIALVKRNKAGLLFVILLLFINVVYAFFYQDMSFIMSSVHWLYGFLLLLALMSIARDQKIELWATRFILFKLILVVLLYFLGLGGYEYWPRYNYFFNGPNQLAYFVICLLLVFVAATRAKWSSSFYVACTLSIFIVISTGGRSAYFALLPLMVLLLWLARRQPLHGLFLLVLPFAVNLVFQSLCLPLYKPGQHGRELSACSQIGHSNSISVSSFTNDRIVTLMAEKKQELDKGSIVLQQLKARGYMRGIEYPEYLFYGAGQGRDERFGNVDGHIYEIHSSLQAVWFYYGIFGLILFVIFTWRIFYEKANLFFLTPLFVYGFFTFGLRSPYFWLALAFLATAPNFFWAKKKADEL
jgi:hypothetical protein